MKWYEKNHRPLPWKGEKNPYLVWLSEIILQQTRVAQGLPYFERFRSRYPTIEDLAAAPEDEVMKLWEGLGYYSRARNMHFTAKHIVREMGGVFPNRYETILKLKGVGPYTAAAIASFAFDLPRAVVDGNVFRVLSRFFGIKDPIDQTAGKKRFEELASRLLDSTQPGHYNQAIMDFGATQCTPQSPDCPSCPLSPHCRALQEGRVDQLPVKKRKLKKKTRFFHYLVLQQGSDLFLRKRKEKDIWRHLYEFALIELPKGGEDRKKVINDPQWSAWVGHDAYEISRVAGPYQQVLSHQKILATFWEVQLQHPPADVYKDLIRTPRDRLDKFAFPKVIDWYLRDKSLYLNLL